MNNCGVCVSLGEAGFSGSYTDLGAPPPGSTAGCSRGDVSPAGHGYNTFTVKLIWFGSQSPNPAARPLFLDLDN